MPEQHKKPYERPQVETVLTPDELAREVLYAGLESER
jgi:hypothetical protein